MLSGSIIMIVVAVVRLRVMGMVVAVVVRLRPFAIWPAYLKRTRF